MRLLVWGLLTIGLVTAIVLFIVRSGGNLLLLLLTIGLVTAIVIAVVVVTLFRTYRRKAGRAGYPSIGAYLRAVPRSDEEKRDAVDLALKGLVICVVGLLVPPLILLGVFPLFYGTRKLLHTSMGLGLVDDGRGPDA